MIYSDDFKSCDSFIGTSGSIKNYKANIVTDSRTLTSEDTFLAITGERFNALSFLEDIKKSGCKNVIYTSNEENNELIKPFLDDITFIETSDSIKFLQEITRILSDKFQDNGGKLIAIGGSNGKTTTKEMLFHVLKSVHSEVICTQKNNNNHIGVPLTLLQINKDTKYAVVELGSNHPGEIETLCNIVNPKYGIVTNIGDTHLEFFENRENVFKEEGYLHQAVRDCGKENKLFFRNDDDEYLSKLSSENFSLGFGENSKDIKFVIEKEHAIVHHNNHEYKFTNRHITGKHNFYNLCVAFNVAQNIDPVNSQNFISACETFKPTANRSQWLELKSSEGKKINVFLDAYNANPSSMRMAISGFLDHVDNKGSHCLIIGDMNELGENASSYHEELGAELEGKSDIYFVGRYGKSFAAKCKSAKVYSTTEEFKKEFNSKINNQYDYLFIKGSRSLQLESILDITLH